MKSQKNNKFFSEFSEIKRFENNLLLLSLNKNSVISDIALDILKKVNIDKLNEEKKELEQNLFVGFDLLINQIQGFGVIEKNF